MLDIKFSPVQTLPDSDIQPTGTVSKAFLSLGLTRFREAAEYVHQLPYGNSPSEKAMSIFEEGFGTCLVKHGIIARLAEEEGLDVYRCEGFYPLTDKLVTGVGAILAGYDLPHLPRIHCFLEYRKAYIDLTEGNCTGKNGPLEEYLEIFRVPAEQTPEQTHEMYRNFYSKICSTDPVFARVGVEGLFEALNRCKALNASLCMPTLQRPSL